MSQSLMTDGEEEDENIVENAETMTEMKNTKYVDCDFVPLGDFLISNFQC